MRIEFLHWFWATLWGYFWQPCPNCGRMFGGHEIGERKLVSYWSHYGEPTCSNKDCIAEVQEHNNRLLTRE